MCRWIIANNKLACKDCLSGVLISILRYAFKYFPIRDMTFNYWFFLPSRHQSLAFVFRHTHAAFDDGLKVRIKSSWQLLIIVNQLITGIIIYNVRRMHYCSSAVLSSHLMLIYLLYNNFPFIPEMQNEQTCTIEQKPYPVVK